MKRAALALLLALAPSVAAQETPFGFLDPTLDAFPLPMNAYADLESGVLERVDDTTLRATLVLNALPELQPGLGYGFLFTVDDIEWYAAVVQAEVLSYYYGQWVDGVPATSSDTSGSYAVGLDAALTIDFPLAAIPNATVLTAPRGLVGDFKAMLLPTGGPIVIHDEAIGEGTLVVREPPPEDPATEEDPEVETAAIDAALADPTEPTGVSPQPTRDTPMGGLALLALALALARVRRS